MSMFHRFWYRKNQLLYPTHTALQDKLDVAEAERTAKESQRDAFPEGSAEYKFYEESCRALTNEITALNNRHTATPMPWWVTAVSFGGGGISFLFYMHPRWAVYAHHHRAPLTELTQRRLISFYQGNMQAYLTAMPNLLKLMTPPRFSKDWHLLLLFWVAVTFGACPLWHVTNPDGSTRASSVTWSTSEQLPNKTEFRDVCPECGAPHLLTKTPQVEGTVKTWDPHSPTGTLTLDSGEEVKV